MALRFTIIDQFGHSTIIDEPVGWDGINLHYTRHKEWHGFIDMVDDTVGTLQFFGDGYHILKNAFTTYGIEAQCGFLVEFQCSDTGSWDTIYQGQFSFYKYKEVQGVNGCHVECSVESSNNVMVLKNRYDQKVDLNSLIPFQTPQNPQASTLNTIQAISTTQNYPPDPGLVDISTGDTYLVPNPSGTWESGTAGYIATWTDAGAFTYTLPLSGQVLVDMSTHKSYVYNGSTWGPFTGQMAIYNALGSEVLMPSKTIQLVTKADVDPSPYAYPHSATAIPSGGSSFTLNNGGLDGYYIPDAWYSSDPTSQSVYSMQLSWIGGLISEGLPSFTGAGSNLWIAHFLGDSAVGADPIFTYTPDSSFTASEVSIDINISGAITAADPSNDSAHPVQVSALKVSLCYGTGSFHDAYNSSTGNLYGAGNSHVITLTGGTQASGSTYFETYVGSNAPINFAYNYTTSVSMATGTNVYLVFEFDFYNSIGRGASYTSFCNIGFSSGSSAAFSIYSSYPDTAAPVYLVNESLSRAAEAITGGNIRAYSDFFGRTDSQPYTTALDGEGSLLCFTNGLLIRGYTLLDGSRPPMPVSLKEMFEALNAIYNIGMCIEPDTNRTGMNRLRIEPMHHFYQPNVMMLCDNVGEVSIENQTDNYVGIFRTGYNKWQGEQTGGLDDFMNKREYRTALSTSKKVLEKYCGFLGSSYAIETTRRQTGINTQDWRFDHENFVICMERNPELSTATATATLVSSTPYTVSGTSYYLLEIGLTLTSGGSGYTHPPRVTITDNTGRQYYTFAALGTLTIDGITTVVPPGAVTAFAPVMSLTTYIPSSFTVSIAAPSQPSAGSGAVGAVILDGSGAVLDVIMTNQGANYSLPPLVQFAAPTNPTVAFGGIQATGIAIMSGGKVTGVQMVNQGYGYTGSSSVNFIIPSTQNLQVEQFALQNPNNTSYTANIIDPTSLYNYRISPVRNAMRWIKSIFQSYSNWMGGVLHFSSGEANIKAKGQYMGIVEGSHQIVPVMENAPMAEDADISYSNFASATVSNYYPLYNNEIVKFTYPLSYNDWVTKIVPNPYGLIQYSVNDGAPQYGWLEDLKYSPFEGTAEFTLKKKI